MFQVILRSGVAGKYYFGKNYGISAEKIIKLFDKSIYLAILHKDQQVDLMEKTVSGEDV